MPGKALTKTDLDKKAIVLTEPLARVLHQRGVFPSLGGDGHSVLAVKAIFKNTGEEILFSFYASMRKEEDRPIEERCWCAAFAPEAEIGDEFVLEFEKGRFTVEIRPPR